MYNGDFENENHPVNSEHCAIKFLSAIYYIIIRDIPNKFVWHQYDEYLSGAVRLITSINYEFK
jgi:hypothetical protein